MKMTSQQLEQTVNAICLAFDLNGLSQLVRFRLGKDLFSFVDRDQPLQSVVFKLVLKAEEEGWTDTLIEAMYISRANNRMVKELVDRYWPQIKTLPETAQLVQTVSIGLEALTALRRTQNYPFVGINVGQFRTLLQLLGDRIKTLNRYATLHDTLHRLNVMYLPAMNQAAALFRRSGPQRDLLMFSMELQNEAHRAREVAQGLRSYRVEEDWIDSLDQAAALVRRGLDTTDNLVLQRGLDVLRRVLVVEPVRIDALLGSALSDLPLEQLIQTLKQIDDHFRQAPPEYGSDLHLLEKFRSNLNGLMSLKTQLGGLIEEYFEWQWIENELIAADTLPGATPAERFPRWPAFRERLVSLCNLRPETGWSRNLIANLRAMEEAGAAQDRTQFSQSYDEFRMIAAHRLFDLFALILDLSNQLMQVVLPLDQLLMITGDSRNN
jgi:hypothetical protein